MANDRYIQWQLIAPPATRFFQLTDGNFSMYFERTRISEMVTWAEAQVEAFRRLELFIEQQTAKVEAPASPDDKPLIPPTPKEAKPQAIAPNIKSIPNPHAKPNPNVRPGENQMVQGLMARSNLVNRGLKAGPSLSKSMVGSVGLTTQEAVEEAVPVMPPRVKPDLTMTDPGLAIALAQQKRLDESKGIDREAKNSAPDEPSPDEVSSSNEPPEESGEPQAEQAEEEPPPNVITAEETQ